MTVQAVRARRAPHRLWWHAIGLGGAWILTLGPVLARDPPAPTVLARSSGEIASIQTRVYFTPWDDAEGAIMRLICGEQCTAIAVPAQPSSAVSSYAYWLGAAVAVLALSVVGWQIARTTRAGLSATGPRQPSSP